MSSLERFVLDANVFIEAAKRYYAFGIVPWFWDKLVCYACRGRILSIDRVRIELMRNKDELAKWAKRDFARYCRSTRGAAVLKVYSGILSWAQNHKQFSQMAKKEFSQEDNADPLLVAYAITEGCVVVTHERYDAQVKRKIPIPNARRHFGVKYVDTFEMLRCLRPTFW